MMIYSTITDIHFWIDLVHFVTTKHLFISIKYNSPGVCHKYLSNDDGMHLPKKRLITIQT